MRRRGSLLELDLGTGLFELLLHLVGIGLRHPLLESLGRALDQVLGLLEAEAGDLADDLDDGDLVRAGFLQLDVELRLLLDGSRGGGGASTRARRRGDGDRSGLDAPLVFEGLDELRKLDDRQVRKEVDDLLTRDVCHWKFSVSQTKILEVSYSLEPSRDFADKR